MTPGRIVTALLILAVITTAPATASACVGDCTNDRLVTVDEIITGVNIALGTGALERCRSFDDDGNRQVTVDELLVAVNSGLRGCPLYGGDYTGSVALGPPWSGEIQLHVAADGRVSGTLLVSSGESAASGSGAAVTFPPGGVEVALSGNSSLASGAFEASGNFVDGNQQPVAVEIVGRLPEPGSESSISVQIGPDSLFGTLTAPGSALPTPTATATPTRTATPLPTATATAISTGPPTRPPTRTPLPTATATQAIPTATSNIPTLTPVPPFTATPTITQTAPPTTTPTSTATQPPTLTPTSTQVPTATPSSTRTATATPFGGLTPTPSPTAPAAGAARIVYAGGAGDFNIFVINVDGTGKTKITDNSGTNAYPAWSPDGTRIAFSTPYKTGAGIAVMNADGANLHVLTTEDSPLNTYPAWSPTGDRIVFVAGGSNVDIMDADGSHRQRLIKYTDTNNAPVGHLSWCPDGSRIAFESTRPHGGTTDGNYEIWTMNPDGSGLLQLTDNAFSDRWPAWSRDTLKIAFDSQRGAGRKLYIMNIDGSGQAVLTADPFGAAHPAWSHDGTQIAYSSLLGLRVANANGTGAVSVPNTDATITDFDFK